MRYNQGAIAFHWIITVLIVLNFALAWYSEDLPKEEHMRLMGFHIATGLTILGLTVLRIVWRLVHPAPPLVDTLKAWELALAKVVHGLLYFLMIAIPLAGWAMVSSFGKGAAVSWYGFLDIPALPVSADKATGEMFEESHEVLAILMLVLLALHVVAALKHQLIDRDATVSRMLPWGKAR